MLISIPLLRQDAVKSKIEKLNRLAERNGFAPIVANWREGTYTKRVNVTLRGERDVTVTLEFRNLEIDAPDYWQIGNYTLLAMLDHDGNVPIMRKTPAGLDTDLSAYHCASAHCDVCGVRRERKQTFIVHGEGKTLQLGSTCVRPFLGVDPSAILAMVALPRIIEEIASIPDDIDPTWYMYTPRQVLETASAVIRERGFVSKRVEYETGQTATVYLVLDCLLGADKVDITDADRERAENVLAWMETLEGSHNDYLYNLYALSSKANWRYRDLGLAVSAISAFERNKAPKAETNASDYVGQVGERLTLQLTYMKTAWARENAYGMSYGHLFQDDDGNVFLWSTSNTLGDPEPCDKFTLVATIKSHKTFHGVRQTVITRCRVQ